MDEWWYDFGASVNQVKNFSLTMNTDFDQIDFPENSIAPTKKDRTAKGWKLQWTYSSLLSSVKLGMVMPQKLNPGPWVCQVSSRGADFAFSLLFSSLCHFHGTADQNSPDELFLYCSLLFQLPSAARVPRGPCFRARGFHHCFRGFRGSCDFLHASRDRTTIRVCPGRYLPVRVPGALLVQLLLQGIHRPCNNSALDCHFVHNHANHRAS